jgi:peptidoglycan hydrolase-like protein with peptidoglycan-binding domain
MNVLDIQTRLKALGFDPKPLDGLPGRRTTAAVTAF